MADTKISFRTYNNNSGTSAYSDFYISIEDGIKYKHLSFDKFREYVLNNFTDLTSNGAIIANYNRKSLEQMNFYMISPSGFSAQTEIDENLDDDDQVSSCQFTTIDYGGIRCHSTYASLDGLCSASGVQSKDGVKIVKNLIRDVGLNKTDDPNALSILNKLIGGSIELREFYGDIIVRSNGSTSSSSQVQLFANHRKIQKAVGELDISNIADFSLCTAPGGSTYGYGMWFNTLDIRKVDTSQCTTISLLNYYNSPCTIIMGNFSNANMGTLPEGFMALAPKFGRRIVMTQSDPPILKNGKLTDGEPVWVKNYDWVNRGKIQVIYVPYDSLDTYRNNTYVGDTIGVTGWSRYGPQGVQYGGRDIIVGYNPLTQFLPLKEDGRTVWLYRKANRE